MNPEHVQPSETAKFMLRRLTEEFPTWAISVPVLFALFVVALIVFFRPERKLVAAIVGGSIVGVVSIPYVLLAYLLKDIVLDEYRVGWLVVLIPVMAVALFYVGMMYIKDSKSVHWLWSIFLGVLRCAVYLILAFVFLLPGLQYSDKQEYESKVIFLFDVSGSMFTVDDVPEKDQDLKTNPLLNRQEKILHWLTGVTDERGRAKEPFIERVLGKTPVTAYRMGPILDEAEILGLRKSDTPYSVVEWKKWLNPDKKNVVEPDLKNLKEEDVKLKLAAYNQRLDLMETLRSGTNIGGSCLQAHKLENNSFVQAIVIVSDGQSNMGSDDARNEFIARVNNPKRTIPVVTVGVGQFRMPVSIRIDDIQAPEETRPDDKFPVRVPLVSTGLNGVKFAVTLEIKRVKDLNGRPVDEKAYVLPPKEGVFKGAGDQQIGRVEFEIDVQELKGIKSEQDKDGLLLEGEWQLSARTPRNEKESKTEDHVTEPIKIQIQKRALRVLLFAGGATREYQFLRTILYREMIEKRMEMCIYLQTGWEDHIDQDVAPERLLRDFPTKLGASDGEPFMSLHDYDVVVAFDPDWSKLSKKQLDNLKEWVQTHGGGVIFVAGPVFSFQLARPGAYNLGALLSIYPVVPLDNRLHGTNLPGQNLGHDTSRPYALNFVSGGAATGFDFMKLEEDGDTPDAGWSAFFWNNERFRPPSGIDMKPRRGFYNFYPVERLKPDSLVIATFLGPKEARIGDKSDAFKDQTPFLVTMRSGAGKTLYIGSGELWRLRAFKDGFHERLWIKMARFTAAGARQQKKYGQILMSRNIPVGMVNFEAQVNGKDLLPLSTDASPTVVVKRIDKGKAENEPVRTFNLTAKITEDVWRGYFTGKIEIREPGEYEFQLQIPNTNESLRQNLIVRKPNPELDNLRTNFGYLYQMSSDIRDLKKVSSETRKDLERHVQMPAELTPSEASRAGRRLFFPLSSADEVAKCLVNVEPRTETVRGRFEDMWEGGYATDRYVDPFWATVLAPLVVGLVGVGILLLLKQWISALVFFGVCAAMSGVIALVDLYFIDYLREWLPVSISYLMVIIVSLLGIEWLARKLLRLA